MIGILKRNPEHQSVQTVAVDRHIRLILMPVQRISHVVRGIYSKRHPAGRKAHGVVGKQACGHFGYGLLQRDRLNDGIGLDSIVNLSEPFGFLASKLDQGLMKLLILPELLGLLSVRRPGDPAIVLPETINRSRFLKANLRRKRNRPDARWFLPCLQASLPLIS